MSTPKPTPRLTLECTFDVTVPEALEYAKELVEKARETGAIISAHLTLPSTEIDLS